MVGPTIILINRTHDFYERREYAFNILSEYNYPKLRSNKGLYVQGGLSSISSGTFLGFACKSLLHSTNLLNQGKSLRQLLYCHIQNNRLKSQVVSGWTSLSLTLSTKGFWTLIFCKLQLAISTILWFWMWQKVCP